MIKECRICGKSFESCNTEFDSILGNWKQFCCDIECAKTYHQKILDSRNPNKTAKELQNFDNKPYNEIKNEPIVKDKIDEIIEEPKIPYTRRRKIVDKVE